MRWQQAAAAASMVLGLFAAGLAEKPVPPKRAPLDRGDSYPAQQRASGHQVQFEIRTGLSGLGGPSRDLILIVFSDRSADTPLLPSPLFGNDILAEFAFSAREAMPGKPLIFTRRVNDLSFLDARFIRVVNHGTDGWTGEALSMTVDGRRILDQKLFPRKGVQAKGGIEKFNGAQWNEKTFWEEELQRIRLDRGGR